MYKEFYGFSEDPFNLTPDPSFLFSPSGYGEVYSSIGFGIQERKGIMVITGEVGAGKTTLINALLRSLSDKIKTAFIFNPKLNFKQLFKAVLFELKIPVAGESTSSLLRRFNEYLQERMAEGENVLIIIDEAQNLTPTVLKGLYRLCQQVPSGVHSLQILLVGQLELEAKLNIEELRPLKQRVDIQRKISLLNEEESREYIDHRLKVVGSSSSKVFTPEAVELICEYANGIPRVINLVCDGALFAGYEASAPVIDAQMVREAIAEIEMAAEEGPLGEKKVPAEEQVIPGMEPSEDKEGISGEKIFAHEEGVAERETSAGGEAIVKKEIVAVQEAMGERMNHRSRQEGDTPRERLLYLKVGIPALFLACLAVFSLVIWFENRMLPLKEEDRNLSPHQRPIGPEEEKSIAAEEGWNLSIITKRYYGSTNPTLIDLVLEANPQVPDLNRIQVQQSIKIPKIREELLLIEAADRTYKIHLGTFVHRDQGRIFRDEPFLKGKAIEIVPRKVSPRETWYRVLAGPFAAKDEALQMIQALKRRGLLPFFPGAEKES